MSLRDHRLVLNREVNCVRSGGITVCINISKGRRKEAKDEPKTEGSIGEQGVDGSVKTVWNARG